MVLGERLSPHDVQIDWREGYSSAYNRTVLYQDPMISQQALTPTEQFQVTIGDENQAFALRVTDLLWSSSDGSPRPSPPTDSGQGARFFAITMEVEPIPDPYRVDPVQMSG